MDTDEHPLLQLSAEQQRDLATLVEDDRISELADETGYSRRRILGVLATLGAGAAVGGVTLEELIGVVEAGADTNDDDGNVGIPSDRVDVFADGVDATSVRTDELQANSITTVTGDTFADIQQAIESHQVVILEEKVYTGNDPLHLDWGRDDVHGSPTTIYAHGAVLDYTGDGKYAVEFVPPADTDETLVKGFDWKGGVVKGPGQSGSDVDSEMTAAIYIEDMFSCNIEPFGVHDADHGMWVRNMNKWSEFNHFAVQGVGNNAMRNLRYGVRLDGEWANQEELNGTTSFRRTDVTIKCGNADEKVLWQNHASTHGGTVEISAFLPDDGIGYHIDSSNRMHAIEGNFRAICEFEFGNENSESVRIDAHQAPLFVMPRIRGAGDRFVSNGTGARGAITDTAFQDLASDREFRFQNGSSTRNEIVGAVDLLPTDDSDVNWSYTWLRMRGRGDAGWLNAIGNRKDEFTLINFTGNGVRAEDGDKSLIPMTASEHVSSGDEGSRSHLGTFAEHPSAGNGDTWYIDGSGTPSEGFYGKTSDGTVQLG